MNKVTNKTKLESTGEFKNLNLRKQYKEIEVTVV